MRGILATLAAIGLSLLPGCREPVVTGPSLLLITVDGLRADTLPCYGSASSDGHGICSLAEGGALFVWAFSTQPRSAPAATSLLTSLPASAHGVTRSAATFLRTNTATLAGQLGAAGLATAAFVTAPELNRSRNLQLGFDHYEVVTDPYPGAAAARATDAFTQWHAMRHPREQAWFAWLHYPAVGDDTLPLQPLSLAELDHQIVLLVEQARNLAPQEQLGIAFTALSGGGGPSSPPLAIERVRVPLIWMPPGGVAAQQLAAPVALLDLAPTFLQQAGLLIPASLHGEPLQVGALPPAGAQSARPLRFEANGERGVVLSRRFYARPLDSAVARTALLPDDGALPRMTRVDVKLEEARAYEAELAIPEAASELPAPSESEIPVPALDPVGESAPGSPAAT